MIIDQVTLAGRAAYLRSENDEINLANATGSPCVGKSDPVGEGMALEINGLTLQIIRDNILEIYHRKDNEQILSIEIIKEMFPGLFKDPYSNRVHNISGFDDFSRGHMEGLRVMEVEGIPALVSTVESSRWLSSIYKMPHPVTINSASWDIPSSKLAPKKSFKYNIDLLVWKEGQNIEDDTPNRIVIVKEATPEMNRFKIGLESKLVNVIAYQIDFCSEVKFDSFLKERHSGNVSDQSVGRPLLTAINFLETVPSSHSYFSIQEIIQDSYEHTLFENNGSGSPKRFTATLNISATLVENESIILKLYNDDFEHLEARMNGRVFLRPPQIDREG